MGGLRRCHSHQVVLAVIVTTATAAALAFLIFASAAYKPSKPNSEAAQSSWFSIWATLISRTTTRKVRRGGERELESTEAGEVLLDRRRLIGPGSSPPTCRSKCGRCSPCKPVHVPIQPGWSLPLEYYPEAWRCKCGNKLYMP